MAADLAEAVAELVRAVRGGRGALLMALDGVPIEQAGAAQGAGMEGLAGEYAGPLRQARALAAELQGGAPRRFSVRGAARRIVFAFVPGDLVLGAEAGPAGLAGQMRYAIAQATGRLGEL
jgi:predicted regulator of Ras-like GTPase activity (Roadblock/LC7/MglB family)